MAQKTEDTRQRLLDAAGEVFAEKGFQAATVREICARADANLAAVNYHFGDKQRLYVEVVRHAHRSQLAQPVPDFEPGMSPAARLRRFVEHEITPPPEENAPAWVGRLIAREMAQPSEACLAVVDDFVRPKAQTLRSILLELLPEGTAPAVRRLIAYSIVGQCLFHRLHWRMAARIEGEPAYRSFTTAQLADHVTRFSLAALGLVDPLLAPDRSCNSACPGPFSPAAPERKVRS